MVLGVAACDSPPRAESIGRSTAEWTPVWATPDTAKLRPGSVLEPSGCTAGFLFVDPATHGYFLGTAAHCVDSEDGTTGDGVGTRVSLAGTGIGTVIYDSDGPSANTGVIQNDPDVDFALILLDPEINLVANPQVLEAEGPTGWMGCAETQAGDLIELYGHGQVFELLGLLQKRRGVLVLCNPNTELYDVAIPSDVGDSGGPMLHADSGRALGMVSGGLFASSGGATLKLIFAELHQAGFGTVALATVDGGYAPAPRF